MSKKLLPTPARPTKKHGQEEFVCFYIWAFVHTVFDFSQEIILKMKSNIPFGDIVSLTRILLSPSNPTRYSFPVITGYMGYTLRYTLYKRT